jgi:hypothetical protein
MLFNVGAVSHGQAVICNTKLLYPAPHIVRERLTGS